MPEGHTIHRLARELQRAFGRRPVSASTLQERFADGAAMLDGATMTRTDAHGKHLFLIFRAHRPADRLLHIHLGLYGKFPIAAAPAQDPRGALRLRIQNDTAWADLRGPTACELITPLERDVIIARLGPDPLRTDADPEKAWTRISRSKIAIGALLMSQEVLSGIGNVYRAEVLFRHQVSPFREGRNITRQEWDAIWADLCVLLRAGSPGRPDRHHPGGGSAAPRPGAAGGLVLRVPAHRRALPGLRHGGAHRGDGRPQSLLVPGLPGRLTR